MKRFFFCVTLALAGLMTSCIDKNEEVDAEKKPEWLGGSIYQELKNPNPSRLTGTFSTYLRLVDDLGYSETLNRTGSKTVFPANDEAFERFFKNNDWGVSSYEQLSEAQKKLLLYSSMLDNALLLSMLPNVSNGTAEPMKGYAVKHQTNMTTTDSIQHIVGAENMPRNNHYWEPYYNKGIDVVNDATRPMMVHITREYMLQNGISTKGENSDFAILTGTPYSEGNAYVFNVGIQKNAETGEYNGDRTCMNGYIHQMEDVIVPPGNMAQVVHRNQNTQLFSRVLNYFAVPVFDDEAKRITSNYNDMAVTNGLPQKDTIYQVRYFSSRSQGSSATDNTALNEDPLTKTPIPTTQILAFDPGWNQYFPKVSRAGNIDVSISDVGAFFVPDDDAVKRYFLPGGNGAYLIDIYGDKPNTAENIAENLDSLHSKNPGVLTSFVRNLMKANFTTSVPSKFPTVINDASEVMGLEVGMIDRKANGKYDITIANNGVVYVINEVIAPDEVQSVMAPATVFPDMQVMNWAVKDRGSATTGEPWHLGLDFQFYLLAMKANYAFFIPEDQAFECYYLDPASLGHLLDPNDVETKRPEVLHFFYDATAKPQLKCERYYYNIETGEVEGQPRTATIASVAEQLKDILNYHTVVLESGEEIGKNHYYQAKHGGTVYIDGGNEEGTHVMSGLQKDGIYFNPEMNQGQGAQQRINGFEAPTIKTIYPEKNGNAYRLSHVIQPPTESVYGVLKGTVINGESVFSEFLELCTGFEADDVLLWAGIPNEAEVEGMPAPQEAYIVFTNSTKLVTREEKRMINNEEKTVKVPIANTCLDMNVKMFNTFNYTLFAPDNTAMQQAYNSGLPRWDDIISLYRKYHTSDGSDPEGGNEEQDIATAKKMIDQIRDFVRFHFVSNSVYADNDVPTATYQTMSNNEYGVANELLIGSQNGTLTISDPKTRATLATVSAGDTQRVVNKMTRDYWFDNTKTSAQSIVTSSFCAVHQISVPLTTPNK